MKVAPKKYIYVINIQRPYKCLYCWFLYYFDVHFHHHLQNVINGNDCFSSVYCTLSRFCIITIMKYGIKSNKDSCKIAKRTSDHKVKQTTNQWTQKEKSDFRETFRILVWVYVLKIFLFFLTAKLLLKNKNNK